MILNVKEYGAVGDGKTIDTSSIQRVLDKASGSKVIIPEGIYLVGALFIRSNTTIIFESGAKFLALKDIKEFPEIFSRVAGVEMYWPAAILNLINVTNVDIQGPGLINGSGPYWWNIYWGKDQKSGRRQWYDEHNLRWIADYEIKRVRSILIYKSNNIRIKDLILEEAGFWNLQITYSTEVEISQITIQKNTGPSTDGIDIDSSENIHIHDCLLSCGDDCIAIKSGRDGDGLRVNKPTQQVEIDHCTILSGYGVTIGSEVSGSIRYINIHDMKFLNSGCGFRMKSAVDRGGIIENIVVSNLLMKNTRFPFSWLMTWHNQYNKKTQQNLESKPDFWKSVAEQIPLNNQGTQVRNITVNNVVAQITEDYKLSSRAFDIRALDFKPMENITFENVKIQASEFGYIEAVNNLNLKNVLLSIKHNNSTENDNYDNR